MRILDHDGARVNGVAELVAAGYLSCEVLLGGLLQPEIDVGDDLVAWARGSDVLRADGIALRIDEQLPDADPAPQ